VLTDLNEVILRDRGPQTRFSTVLYARLAPGGRGVAATVASAGHPLPLVARADGAVERLGRPGTLLGPFPRVRVRDDTARLDPGDALVLYTDGVTEARRGGEVYGEARLRTLLAARGDATADQLAAAIEADVTRFQGGPLPDDLAVVVLRVQPGARPAPPPP
jgi:serine phosphatase RsbU (regulator of sigma subunit)